MDDRGVVKSYYQVSVVSYEGEIPDFSDMSGQGLEAVLDAQIPELYKGVLRTGDQNVGTALHKSHLKRLFLFVISH